MSSRSLTVSPADLAEQLGAGVVHLLDVRTEGEFVAQHIAGSVNVPLGDLPSVAGKLAAAHGAPLTLVCRSGPRAEQASGLLRDAGVPAQDAVVLAGGLDAWVCAGLPVQTTSASAGPSRWALERQIRLVAGSIVLVGLALGRRWRAARLLSAGIAGGLVFSAATNTCAMGAVLLKLPYNRRDTEGIDAALAQLAASPKGAVS